MRYFKKKKKKCDLSLLWAVSPLDSWYVMKDLPLLTDPLSLIDSLYIGCYSEVCKIQA